MQAADMNKSRLTSFYIEDILLTKRTVIDSRPAAVCDSHTTTSVTHPSPVLIPATATTTTNSNISYSTSNSNNSFNTTNSNNSFSTTSGVSSTSSNRSGSGGSHWSMLPDPTLPAAPSSSLQTPAPLVVMDMGVGLHGKAAMPYRRYSEYGLTSYLKESTLIQQAAHSLASFQPLMAHFQRSSQTHPFLNSTNNGRW